MAIYNNCEGISTGSGLRGHFFVYYPAFLIPLHFVDPEIPVVLKKMLKFWRVVGIRHIFPLN